nr:unnamed protein product [Callosobruchus chinensis]
MNKIKVDTKLLICAIEEKNAYGMCLVRITRTDT